MAKKSKKTKKQQQSSGIPNAEYYAGLAAVFIVVLLSVFLIKDSFPSNSYFRGVRFILSGLLVAIAAVSAFWYCIKSREFKYRRYLAAAAVACCGIVYLMTVSTGWFFGGDSGHYLGLARSLAHFQGFVEFHHVEPVVHTLYGFGLPLLLVPVIWLFGTNIIAVNVMMALISAAAVGAFYYLFRNRLNPYILVLFLIALGMNHWIVRFAAVVMTEAPFFLFMALTLFSVDRYLKEDSIWTKWLAASVIFGFMAYETKVIGIGLVPGIFVFFLLHRRWKKALVVPGLIMVLFLAWNVRNYLHGNLGYFQVFLQTVSTEAGEASPLWEHDVGMGVFGNLFAKPFIRLVNGGKFLTPMVFSVWETSESPPYYPFHVIMLILTYFGLAVHFWKKRAVFDIGIIILFAGVSIYGGSLFTERWWMPFIPFTLFYIVYGWSVCQDFVFRKWRHPVFESILRIGFVALLSLIIGLGMFHANRMMSVNRSGITYSNPTHEAYVNVAQWVKQNTPQDAVFASRLDKEFYLISDRHGVNSRSYFGYEREYSDEIRDEVLKNISDNIIDNDIDYWILDNTRPDTAMLNYVLDRNIDVFNTMFQVVYAYPHDRALAHVLQVKKEWVAAERERRSVK